MQTTVKDAHGGGLLGQESPPCSKGPVGGDRDRPAFLGCGDEPEAQLGSGVVERGEADLVEDDQLVAQQRPVLCARRVAGARGRLWSRLTSLSNSPAEYASACTAATSRSHVPSFVQRSCRSGIIGETGPR